MLAAQAVVDTQGPALKIGENAMGSGQDDMGGHGADYVGGVVDAGNAGICRPLVGLGGGARSEIAVEEEVQAAGRTLGTCCGRMRPELAPAFLTSTAPTTTILPRWLHARPPLGG